MGNISFVYLRFNEMCILCICKNTGYVMIFFLLSLSPMILNTKRTTSINRHEYGETSIYVIENKEMKLEKLQKGHT